MLSEFIMSSNTYNLRKVSGRLFDVCSSRKGSENNPFHLPRISQAGRCIRYIRQLPLLQLPAAAVRPLCLIVIPY
jgi:hypothetical protein